MNICPECGRKWPLAAKFCPFDGAALGEDGAVESEAAQAEKTVTDLIQAVTDPSSSTASEKKAADAEDANDTIVMPIPTFEEKAKVPPPPEPEEELGKFSETSWFMAAADIEELNSDAENVSIDEDRYRPDEDLESEIRKKFSLREPDEK